MIKITRALKNTLTKERFSLWSVRGRTRGFCHKLLRIQQDAAVRAQLGLRVARLGELAEGDDGAGGLRGEDGRESRRLARRVTGNRRQEAPQEAALSYSLSLVYSVSLVCRAGQTALSSRGRHIVPRESERERETRGARAAVPKETCEDVCRVGSQRSARAPRILGGLSWRDAVQCESVSREEQCGAERGSRAAQLEPQADQQEEDGPAQTRLHRSSRFVRCGPSNIESRECTSRVRFGRDRRARSSSNSVVLTAPDTTHSRMMSQRRNPTRKSSETLGRGASAPPSTVRRLSRRSRVPRWARRTARARVRRGSRR